MERKKPNCTVHLQFRGNEFKKAGTEMVEAEAPGSCGTSGTQPPCTGPAGPSLIPALLRSFEPSAWLSPWLFFSHPIPKWSRPSPCPWRRRHTSRCCGAWSSSPPGPGDAPRLRRSKGGWIPATEQACDCLYMRLLYSTQARGRSSSMFGIPTPADADVMSSHINFSIIW